MNKEQRSHVPKFGNWESEENVPYTAYFDKARKGRTGTKIINPNDPQENPDMFSDNASEARSPPRTRAEQEESIGQQVTHEHRLSKEDGDQKQVTDSPARNDNLGRRPSTESTQQRQGGRGMNSGETYRKPRTSGGSEHSIDRSPLHPHHQARIAGRGTGSPSWEGKGSSYDSSHGTPGRSRMKPTRGDESPDKGAAVPKFGDWDENNPSSADGYTHIFNKVREERQTGAATRVPGMASEPSYQTNRKHSTSSSKSCCFPWGRK